MKTNYVLECLSCGRRYESDDFRMECDEKHYPALLRAVYGKKLIIHREHRGIFRYSEWLPIQRKLQEVNGPVVYHSKDLGYELGLNNLFIAFNGYWPEKNAFMETCSFKELEVPGVCGRLPENEDRILVVASAGNTGRSFLNFCSKNDIPVIVVVPDKSLSSIWSTEELGGRVKLVSLTGNADYFDSIKLGSMIAGFDGFIAEGGAKNVGRRDGMGIVVLSATETIGVIPEHYFQAVGSGTGGIAAWEMSKRLLKDGRFGNKRMKLHLSQNHPFTPMVDAWERGSRELEYVDEEKTKRIISNLYAKVLSNRKPPYSIKGGVYDALSDSNGIMYRINARESILAGAVFEEVEGIDLDPAAEVAVASLFKAVEMKTVKKDDVVLLNITGGGYKRLKKEKELLYKEPDLTLTTDDSKDFIRSEVEKLFEGVLV